MIRQKFLIDFGSKILIYFFSAIVGIIVSRVAGPKVIGTVAFGFSYVSIFFFMFGLFGTSHIKLISEGENLKKCNKIYSLIIFITFIVYIITVLTFFNFQKKILNISFTNDERIVIYFSILVVGIQGLFKVPDITFTALVQQVKINLPKLINSVVFNVGRLIVVFLGYKALALVSVKLLGVIIIIPIYLYLMGKDFFNGKWDNNLFKRYLKIGIPILLITVSISIIGNYSKVLLKNYSSITELGYYSGAVGLASMFIMVGSTAGDLFFPLFSKAFAEKKLDYIRNQMSKYEHFLFRFILPIIVVFSINSNTIITFLLGDKFSPSVPIFSVLIFYSFFKIWTIPFYNLMNGINKFNLNAITFIFYLIIFYLFLFFLINPNIFNLGGLGLAVSLLLLEIVKLLVWYSITNKIVSFKFNKDIIKFPLFFILFYSISFIIYNLYILNLNFFLKFIFLIINFSMIFYFMYVLRLINKMDFYFVLELLNFKSLKEYFKKEINK